MPHKNNFQHNLKSIPRSRSSAQEAAILERCYSATAGLLFIQLEINSQQML